MLRETIKFLPVLALPETEIEDGGNSAARHFPCRRPYPVLTADNARHRPAGIDRLRRVHPEKRGHPFVDGEMDGPRPRADLARISGLSRARRAADEMDEGVRVRVRVRHGGGPDSIADNTMTCHGPPECGPSRCSASHCCDGDCVNCWGGPQSRAMTTGGGTERPVCSCSG